MFFGEHRHQLDEKCRIRIPAKLKEQLGDRPFIMRGTNRCLFVLKESDANAILESQFRDVEMVDPINNQALRSLTSQAFFAEEDKQGRIMLPTKLLEHIGVKEKGGEILNRNIVTIGALNRVEIWAESIWDEYSDLSPEEFDKHLAETLKLKKAQKESV